MQVVKPGRQQAGWSKEFECTGARERRRRCGATLLVEQGDLFTTHSSCMGESEMHVTFRCAACGVLTDLPAREWPPSSHSLPTQREWDAKSEGGGDV